MPPAAERKPDRANAPALEGRLNAISLFDLAQFLMLNRKTGTLTLRSGARSAYFTFRDGRILNALDDALRDGEKVVLQAVQWTDGTFEFQPGPVPPDQTIHTSTENLLLEAARQLDEMNAGAAMEAEGDEAAQSHEEMFRRTQETAAGLSDAFRRAMAGANLSTIPLSWKENALRSLLAGDAERILVSADGRVHLLADSGVSELRGVRIDEVLEWRMELFPALAPPVPVAGGETKAAAAGRRAPTHSPDSAAANEDLRLVHGPEGRRLWVVRHPAPEGDWLSLSMPSDELPAWEALGLTEDLAHRLQSVSGRALLLGAADPRTTAMALAAWLGRRARASAEVGWVIEPSPNFDWDRLPGRLATYPVDWLRERGALLRLADTSGARLIALRDVHDSNVLREALMIAARGAHVVIATSAESLPQVIQFMEGHLRADTATGFRDWVGGVWLVRRSADPSGLPWQNRFLSTAEMEAIGQARRAA